MLRSFVRLVVRDFTEVGWGGCCAGGGIGDGFI